jgi:hypothetical protein
MDETKSFVNFVVMNAINSKLFQFPCKKCHLNKKLSSHEVYTYLSSG